MYVNPNIALLFAWVSNAVIFSDFSDNDLIGTIPDSLEELTQLEILYV